MFRSMLKRSFLSIKRKLGRTIILTLIFFMMANLVLAAITIKTAVAAQMDYAKSTLGGTVTIQADMDAIRESQKEEMEKGGDRKEMFKNMVRPVVTVETANKIAEYSDYVKDYSYELSSSANSADLDVVESKNEGVPGGGFGDGMSGMPGSRSGNSSDDDSKLEGDITISGINAYAYISGVQNETFTIKDGEYFDEGSNDKAMISYEFAELNDLKVGSKFKIKNIYTEKAIELEVIGIYDTSEERSNANAIYMNIETAAKFLGSDDYNDGKYDVSNVNYYMNNSDKAEEFVEKVNADFKELSENKMKMAIDTSEYDAMSGSIESVGSFATTILVIVIVAAIIIVTLIVTINVKDRRYEMGVLLSLGAHKRNIIGQIATELLIVGTLGFVLVGQGILESQITASTQQSERNFGRPGAQVGGSSKGGSMPSMPSMPDMGGQNMKQKIMASRNQDIKLDINATPIDFLLLFVTGYLVIVLALILPSVNVLRYQPKEILAGKE